MSISFCEISEFLRLGFTNAKSWESSIGNMAGGCAVLAVLASSSIASQT